VSGDGPRYVFDSFALLAYFGAEPGGPRVKALLAAAAANQAAAYLSVINYGELIYVTERDQGVFAARRAIAAVDQLPITVVEADRRLTFAAAHVKAHHRLSYADAFAVAVAQQMQAILVTGDPEFRAVEHLVTVEWLPQQATRS
jgi:predicted nucleic acid-binding protein